MLSEVLGDVIAVSSHDVDHASRKIRRVKHLPCSGAIEIRTNHESSENKNELGRGRVQAAGAPRSGRPPRCCRARPQERTATRSRGAETRPDTRSRSLPPARESSPSHRTASFPVYVYQVINKASERLRTNREKLSLSYLNSSTVFVAVGSPLEEALHTCVDLFQCILHLLSCQLADFHRKLLASKLQVFSHVVRDLRAVVRRSLAPPVSRHFLTNEKILDQNKSFHEFVPGCGFVGSLDGVSNVLPVSFSHHGEHLSVC